jgi:predicted dehydrogenase
MSEKDMLHIGLVGCGWHGEALAQAVLRSKTLRLVACADPDTAAAAAVAVRGRSVSTYTTVADLLEVADVDAVLVATPHDQLGRT